MNRYPNHKVMMLVLVLALGILSVILGRLPKVDAAPAPAPICTTNPVVTNDFDNGAESLRQAVFDACPGSTITFDLTGTIQLFGGHITIDKNLSIIGPGASVLTVQNIAAQSATSRIFFVNAGVTATITRITISGGNVTGDGAGIYNNGVLTVSNSTITNNTMVGDGGGVYNNGTLTIIGSTISSNGATANSETGTSRVGGGIYNNGTLTVTGSTIHDNRSSPPSSFHLFIGGGIYNAGTANVSKSTFSNNVAGAFNSGGAAISNVLGGTLNVTDSIFDSNLGRTGGIFNFAGTTNITNSTFTTNRGLQGGAIYSVNGAVIVTNSTISNNHTDNNLAGGGGGGGGIYLDFGSMTLTNSTVSNNRADGPIAEPNRGGGIYITNGTLNLANSTIANNTAMGASQGGGIYRSSGTVNSRNSIIAGNSAGGGPDFFGTLNSQGYNLIGNTANTTITGVTTGNILNQDPLLLPLADNGGSTKTLSLQPNSPAIDAGDSSGSTIDQRAAVRPSDQAPANVSDGADIGAFEFSPNTTITAHPTNPSNSSTASFSFTVTNGVAFAGFQCRLDGAGFTACASPQTYNSLSSGSHTFTVRAVDNGGNAVGLQPSFTWTIDTVSPQTTIDNNPDNPSAPNVGFRFSGTDSGTGVAGFECDLDSGGFTACTGPRTFLGLTPGSHTFQVRAIDVVGNVDPTPASFTWSVDRICTISPVVRSSVEGDDGSLRLAVTNACAGSTITFNMTGRIRLSSGQITLDKNLAIQGPGAHLLEIRNTAATSRVFLVNSGVTATIAGLSIAGGFVNDTGGGIYNSGALTVTNSTIRNNHALNGGGIYNFLNSTLIVVNSTIENNEAVNGGGIQNAVGTVNVTNSTINNNNANSAGGGIYNDGVLSAGVMTVTNSTISNNTVGNFAGAVGGGGIRNNNDGTVNLINSTITNNSELAAGTSFGGGINNLGPGTVNCRNTIIAGNTGTFGDFAGSLTSQGYNLIGVTSGTAIVGDTTGNITGTNARLGPLVFNGGQTMTHALLSDSPALNAGNTATSPAADQRGAGRIGTADIGAFELNNSANGGNFVATLPDGLTGITYSYVLVANRGAWTYSVTGGALPSGISLLTNGAIVSVGGTTNQSGLFNFTVTGTDGVNSIVTDYSVRFLDRIVSNTAPDMVTSAPMSRQQGSSPGAAVTVGVVSDAETAPGSLTVTEVAGGTATGITVSNITNIDGTITAQVSADCNATSGTVRFEVSDGSLTGAGDLQVNVSANTAPLLTYSNAVLNLNGATSVNPVTGPTDNGSISAIAVQSTGTYGGTLSLNTATGAVSLSNAAPAGTHTITIRVTDNCGLFTDASFTVDVSKGEQTISFNGLGPKTYGDAPFSVSATGGSSGNPINFSSQIPAVCTVAGATVTIVATGTCTIRASQGGNSNYNPAPDVDRSFTVSKAAATVTLSNLSHTYDGTAKSATATTNPTGKTVVISYSQGGNAVAAPTNVGSYDVLAVINDANYQGSTTGVLTIVSGTCFAPPANLVGWWPGDNNAKDLAGGHDGVLQGSAGFAAGEVLQAFSLNGTSAFVQAVDNPSWDLGSNSFTIDLWVNFNQVNATNVLVAHDEGAGNLNKWVFWVNNGQLDFHTNDTLGNAHTVGVPFSPVPGMWYQLAVKRQGNNYTFYINGSPSAPIAQSSAVPNAVGPLTIGAAEGGNFVNGLIDEVEIFNRALSDTELQTIFALGNVGQCKPADLRITKSHNGNFSQGEWGVTYSITVTNDGPSPTSGTVTVADTLPDGLSAGSIGGSGWTCLQPAGPCHRTDPLSPGASYSRLNIKVNVANDAPPLLTNTASVTGGEELDVSDNTATDPTTIGSPDETPILNADAAMLLSESCPSFKPALDPGERITVTLKLANNGTGSTTNLVATLLSSGGVTAPSGPPTYGSLKSGQTAGRDFGLTINPKMVCGGTLTATLQLQDGANNLGTVSFNFTLGLKTRGVFVCAPCGGSKQYSLDLGGSGGSAVGSTQTLSDWLR